MIGLAVEPLPALTGVLVDVPAELGRDDYTISKRLDRLAEDALALVQAVGFRGIEEGNVAVVRCPNERDLLRPVGDRRLVFSSIVLNPQPYTGDLQVAEFPARNRTPCGSRPAALCRSRGCG